MHGLLYTPEPDELRAFIRDKLGLPFTDTGEGWLIFDLPEADLGVHPSKKLPIRFPSTATTSRRRWRT